MSSSALTGRGAGAPPRGGGAVAAVGAKPGWVGEYVPALDGLRGLAILLVLVEHCQPRLRRLGLGGAAGWGWVGVDLFFVLSGYLITGIVLDGRRRQRFFRAFYARRALRILPVIFLVVAGCAWIFGPASFWRGPAPFWLFIALFMQNLGPWLSGVLYPAWSLAIEEQFYLVWAPVARRLPAAWLGALLAAVLVLEPWIRGHAGWWAPVHTLYHLDGLAMGALLALGLRTLGWSERRWRAAAAVATLAGLAATVAAARWWGPGINSGVALGFGGLVLAAVALEARGAPMARGLRWAPLRGLGRVSYGLYLVHMPVFVLLGGFEARLAVAAPGAAGDAAIVLMRWSASIAVAALLWLVYERPILSLKRYF